MLKACSRLLVALMLQVWGPVKQSQFCRVPLWFSTWKPLGPRPWLHSPRQESCPSCQLAGDANQVEALLQTKLRPWARQSSTQGWSSSSCRGTSEADWREQLKEWGIHSILVPFTVHGSRIIYPFLDAFSHHCLICRCVTECHRGSSSTFAIGRPSLAFTCHLTM